MARYNMFWLID